MGNDDEEEAKKNFISVNGFNKSVHNGNGELATLLYNSYRTLPSKPALKQFWDSLVEITHAGDEQKYNSLVEGWNGKHPEKAFHFEPLLLPSDLAVLPAGADGFYLMDINPLDKKVNYPDYLIGKDGRIIVDFIASYNGKNKDKFTGVLQSLNLLKEADKDGRWHFYKTGMVGGKKVKEVPFLEAYMQIIERMPDIIVNKEEFERFKSTYVLSKDKTHGSLRRASRDVQFA